MKKNLFFKALASLMLVIGLSFTTGCSFFNKEKDKKEEPQGSTATTKENIQSFIATNKKYTIAINFTAPQEGEMTCKIENEKCEMTFSEEITYFDFTDGNSYRYSINNQSSKYEKNTETPGFSLVPALKYIDLGHFDEVDGKLCVKDDKKSNYNVVSFTIEYDEKDNIIKCNVQSTPDTGGIVATYTYSVGTFENIVFPSVE